ncbi:hypothetical protein [Intrasporangium flavum]|uniref:hypothetical protein n=1 Tax=Intrasporangium flavum TaxID=1428657 RepID=UPI001A96DA3C|nr:hypothetical protein [Intrasporangium flavum]
MESSSGTELVLPTTTGESPVSVSSSCTTAVILATTGTSPIGVGSSSRTLAEADLLAAHGTTRFTSHAGTPTTPDVVAAHGTTRFSSHLGLPRDVEHVSAHGTTRFSTSATPLRLFKIDATTHLPQFRLLVVDRTGTPLGELKGAQLGDATYAQGGVLTFSFTIRKNHPRAHLLDIGTEVQIWSGDEMIRESWFVIVEDPTDGGPTWTFKCEGTRWHLGNAIIGRPRPELLKNGGFEDNLKHWHPVVFPGSASMAPPTSQIVKGAQALAGGKALRTTAVLKVVVKEEKTAAIFKGNQPYAGSPLASGYLAGGEQIIRNLVADIPKGQTITLEAFTADVDSGNGQKLSERRAAAAKATILAARPDLHVNDYGRGETVQVAPNDTPANQAKNRRILLTWDGTRIGHRQAHNQWFTFENDTRVPTALEISLWANLIDYVGPSKDGWLGYINRRHASAPHKILDEKWVTLPPTFPKQRWTPQSFSIDAPANSTDIYELRLYGTAGDTIFDEVSVKPNVLTAWYNVTRPTLYAGLIAHAQDPTFGKVDLNIETNCPSFGIRDDYEYEHKRHRTVNDALAEQLSADDSPEFWIDTTPTRRIARTAARRGRRSQVHLELGGVVEDFTTGGDADKRATVGIVTSDIDGGAVLEAYARGPRVNGLAFERTRATEPNRTVARAGQIARQMIRYGSTSDDITSVTCKPSKTLMLLQRVWVGDVCRTTVKQGGVNADSDHRVTEVRISFARRQITYELAQEV